MTDTPATGESRPALPGASGAGVPAGTKVGTYEIVRILGQGGMGAVYLAYQPSLRRYVALKVLPADADGELVERFKREARASARLRHPGIVSVHEVGEENGRHFFTMDHVEGGTLQGLVKRSKGRLPVLKAFEVVRKIVDALDYAHSQGVVHRDLKPANIMLDKHGDPLIADFGLARVKDDVSLSRSGQMVGTPHYMAPEQAKGDIRHTDARSDVWSVGAFLYEMVSGALPFPGQTTIDIVVGIMDDDPPPLHVRMPGLPRDAEAIVFKCLNKDPAKRYQAAAELRDDIDRFLNGLPVTARPVTRWRRAASWLRRNKAIAITATLGFLGISITLLYTLWLGPEFRRAARRYHVASLFKNSAAFVHAEQDRLLKVLEDGGDTDGVIRQAKELPQKVRDKFAPKDDEEKASVEEAVGRFEIGPILSRAHFVRKEWPLAARYDPSGRWGLNAQVEIAKKFVADLRLAEAGTALKRIRSRYPESEAAKRAIAVLGDILAEQGDLEGALAAYLESGTQKERVELLQSILGQRSSTSIPNIGVWAEFGPSGCEPMPLLRLDAPTIVLPYRQGRPAYRLTRDGLVAVPSPLAALASNDHVADVCDVDLDGDGRREVLATLWRPGSGGGFALMGRDGESWKILATQLSSAYQPTRCAAGDLDGDGKDEAFVTFMWRAGHHWFLNASPQGISLNNWNPGLERPWIESLAIADLDGDGRKELLVGRTTHVGNRLEVFEVRNRQLGLAGHHIVGAPSAIVSLGDGLVAMLAAVEYGYVTPEMRDAIGPDPRSALAILRWRDGRFEKVARLDLGPAVGTDFIFGNLRAGRLAGRQAICCTSTKGAFDALRKRAEGQRMRVILGDPTSEPHALGLPWGASNFHLHDLDGDGESELIVLSAGAILVMEKRSGPAPRLPTIDAEPPPAHEAAVLMRGANDLLGFESFDAARDLLAEVAARFPSRPESAEARRLRVDALMRSAELDFAVSSKVAHDDAAKALEAERSAMKKCRDAASEARAEAAKCADQPALRRRFLLLAADASRRALDFAGTRADLAAALESARSFDDTDLEKRIRALDTILGEAVLIEGDLCAEGLPFITDNPTRVRRVKGGLEAALDSHSERFVAGVPISYGGGAVSVALDLELDTSVWSAGAQIGLFYRNKVPNVADYASLAMFLHGTTEFDKQGAAFRLPEVAFHADRYRGRWRIAWTYRPEVDLQTLEIRDAKGDVLYSGRSPAMRMIQGDAILGISIEYGGGDALLTHPLHPPVTALRITNVTLAAASANVDRGPKTDVRGFELEAGGRLFRGDAKGAAELYRQAIDRDARLIRARVFLALAVNGSLPLSEAFRIDPYETACAIDDAIRGADPRVKVALGGLLRELLDSAKGLPRAACLSFLGDYEDALAEIEKLPNSAAKFYLLRRNQLGDAPKQNEAWDWIFGRGMRTAGMALPVVAWAPGPGDTRESLRQELAQLAEPLRTRPTALDAMRAWAESSRYLLLFPEDVEILRFRSQVALIFQKEGEAELDLLRVAHVAPADVNAQLAVAQLYARRRHSIPTMEFLVKAVDAGLRDARVFDAQPFQFLKERADFKSLQERVR